MLKINNFRNKLAWGASAVPMALLTNATSVLADDSTPGGALPTDNPFKVNWGDILKGDLVTGLLPLFNYGLGLYGLYLLWHSIRHLLEKSKQLMKGEASYKDFIPVVVGLGIVLLVLSGAWYSLLYAILAPLNKSFTHH